uniref:MFS domain-containing protein n=1 Tax=Rhabditophanes sp. KR3021 TaxID=114890 RepID=A0AC35TFR0_9BILA
MLGNIDYWHYIYLIIFFTSLIYLTVCYKLPNTPKYLYLVKRNMKGAQESLQYYHGLSVNYKEVFNTYDKEEMLQKSIKIICLTDVIRTPHLRKVALLVLVSTIIGIVSMDVPIVAYFEIVVVNHGGNADWTSWILLYEKIPLILACAVAPILFQKFGVNKSIFVSMLIGSVAWILMIIADLMKNDPVTRPTSFILLLAALTIEKLSKGFGKISAPIIIINELCPIQAKEAISSMMIAIALIGVGLIGAAYIPLFMIFGNGLYVFYFAVYICSTIYFISMVPKCRGDSVVKLYDDYEELL